MNAGAPAGNVRDTKRFCVARRLAGGPPRGARNARNRIGETRAVVSIRLGGEGACVPFVMSSEVETSLIFPENSERFLGYAWNDKKERRQGCRLLREGCSRSPLLFDSMRFGSAMPCPHLCLGDHWSPVNMPEGHASACPGRAEARPSALLFQIAQRAPRGPGLDKFSPAQIVSTRLMLSRFTNRHF